MLNEIQSNIYFYLAYYYDSVLQWWSRIGPKEYGTVLVVTLVFGYLLLKSANRK